MAHSNFTQSSFLGGEWSPLAQGRIDLPDYRRAMNVCLNALPLQEGAWTRRGGFLRLGHTRGGFAGIIRPFTLPNNAPGYLEMTFDGGSSWLQIWVGNSAGTQFQRFSDDNATLTAISTATPAQITIGSSKTWSTGDRVSIVFDTATAIGPFAALGNQRALTLTRVDGTHFTLADGTTGSSINGTGLSYSAGANDKVFHTLQIQLPYTSLADLQQVRVVKADNAALLLHRNYPPKVIYYNGVTFTLVDANAIQWDGPYVEPLFGNGESQQGVSSGVVDSWLAPTTFTISDGSYSFSSADNGKLLRLWSQPPAWDSTVNYQTVVSPSAGDKYVTYQGAYYRYNDGVPGTTTGKAPGTSFTTTSGSTTTTVVPWIPAPWAGNWNFFKITSIISASSVGIALAVSGIVVYPSEGTYLTAEIWQLGAYGPNQYPSCGGYHEGRLFLGGAIKNRFDASVSDALDQIAVAAAAGSVPPLSFSPTDRNGNVGDANAITGVLNDDELNDILWFAPHAQGMTCGTPGGEFLIEASAMNDPVTPSTVQAHKVTKYKALIGGAAEGIRVGTVILYIQAFGRRVLEYFADAFTAKLSARHLNEYAGHLAQSPLVEIRYQEERSPILWARRNDGGLIGCTYRRFAQFANQPPEFAAWHRHTHGGGNVFESICVGPAPSGTPDNLLAITQNPDTSRQVEVLTDIFEENFKIGQAQHLDGAQGFVAGSDGGTNTLTLYLPPTFNGRTVSVWLAGLYCGDYVASGTATYGTIAVPYLSDPGGAFIPAVLQAASAAPPAGGWPYAGQLDITPLGGPLTRVVVPVVVGFNPTAQGQTLRPLTQEDTRTQSGASLGMTRRISQVSALAVNTIGSKSFGLRFGPDFNNLQFAAFKTSNDDDLFVGPNTLFNGVFWDTTNGDYDYDGMVAWDVVGPYPATIALVSGFIDTEERA